MSRRAIVSSPGKSSVDDRISWSLIVAALAAFAALYITSDRFIGLPIMAVLLVASRFTKQRLPLSRVLSWSLRAGILAVVITLVNAQSDRDTTPWYLKQQDTNLAGYALAADLVLRAWERRDATRLRESSGVFILITACALTAATHTYQRLPIQLITPVYCVFTLLALRSLSRFDQPRAHVRGIRKELVALRIIVVLMSLGTAFIGIYLITHYEYQVTSWAVKNLTRKHGPQNQVGFSTSPQLSSVFNPQASIDRVLLIDGTLDEEHLRVMAFDRYSQQQWLPSLFDRQFHAAVTDSKANAPGARQQIARLIDTSGLLPLPLESERIDADALEEDDSATLRDIDAKAQAAYEVTVPKTPAFQGPLCMAPNPAQRQRLLAIPPEIDPKVIELSKQVAGMGDPAHQLFRIQQHLRAHHQYSLSFNPKGEPLNDFLLNDRAAHCQYFASAVVIMARAVGIPARFVNGFYAHEQYGSNQMVVRQRDAHAWAECWIDGLGWLTTDATPASGRPDAIFKDPPAWRRWWEKLSDLPAKIREWLGDKYAWIGPAVAVIAGLALILWAIQFILNHRRRPKPVPAGYPQPSAELTALSRRFEQWLQGRGTPCPPQQTWRDHLATIPVGSTSNRFVDAYEAARFGGSNDETVTIAGKLLAQIEADITK